MSDKKRKAQQRSDFRESPLTILNSRLLIKIAARVREHDALIQLYLFLPTGHPFLLAMQAKGREWAQDKDKPNRPPPPPPYVYKVRGLLQATRDLPTIPDTIKADCDKYLKLSDDTLARLVFVCKTTKALDRAQLRVVMEVEFSVRTVFANILSALLPVGSRQLLGVAPRNNMEREIADMLVELGIFSPGNALMNARIFLRSYTGTTGRSPSKAVNLQPSLINIKCRIFSLLHF